MKKSDKQPFMPPPDYGQSLRGFTINLLTVNIVRSLLFQRDVIAANILHEDLDLLILNGYDNNWMIHADHAYDTHPLLIDTLNSPRRGAGVELRLHGRDPDEASTIARQHGFQVLDGSRDQPDHGLREAHIVDDDGYVWVPDVPL
ncbi:MAG: hypothetical protein ACI8XC_001661 [Gammaproteobacteria bacterium]|jgi:hypothetical protein